MGKPHSYVLLIGILIGTTFLEDNLILLKFKSMPLCQQVYVQEFTCSYCSCVYKGEYKDISCSVFQNHCQVMFFLNLNVIICNVLLIYFFVVILAKTGQAKTSVGKGNKSSGMFFHLNLDILVNLKSFKKYVAVVLDFM